MIPQSPGHAIPPAVPPVPRQPAPQRRTRRRRMLVMTSTAAVILGAMVLVRYVSVVSEGPVSDDPLERSEQAAAIAPDPEPVPATTAPEALPVASAGFVASPVEEAPAVKARPKKPATVTPAKKTVAASATVAASTKTTAKSTAPIAATTTAKVPATTGKASYVSTASAAPPVTLTGCLEMSVDRDDFRLNDTEGAGAPRARSWRTGFLKKRTTPVALVQPPDPHGLQAEVGKRVAATGVLTDREMRVSSVRVVGASCE